MMLLLSGLFAPMFTNSANQLVSQQQQQQQQRIFLAAAAAAGGAASSTASSLPVQQLLIPVSTGNGLQQLVAVQALNVGNQSSGIQLLATPGGQLLATNVGGNIIAQAGETRLLHKQVRQHYCTSR